MIGSTLRKLLTERHMSVGDLAEQIGVPAQTIYSIIRRDNMKIDFEALLRICDVLGVTLDVFSPRGTVLPRTDTSDWAFLGKYRSLDKDGRDLVELVIDTELERVRRAKANPPQRVIPLYLTPAAAGYASPALGDDYEDMRVPADSGADFAVRIEGDSMEPFIADGETVLVRRCPIANGDVGLFFVDGDMKCKQYVRDGFGNVYLVSLNRDRADADVHIPATSGVTLCCFGKVLLEKRPPVAV